MADITAEVRKLEMVDRHAARSLFGGVHQLYMNVHVVKHTYKAGLFYTPENTLCKPSWKNVKLHHRDSNQGPAYQADVLTSVLQTKLQESVPFHLMFASLAF